MKNLEKYLNLLNEEVDGLLLTSRYSRYYGAEYDIAEGAAIVTKVGCRYYTDSRYIEPAQKNIQGFRFWKSTVRIPTSSSSTKPSMPLVLQPWAMRKPT